MRQSTLETPRLWLRPLHWSDAPAVQAAASARAIADTMISVPHPYPSGEAERYIARQQVERKRGHAVSFVLALKAEERFCGLLEVRDIDCEHLQAELSFWVAVEAWGRGLMTEALRAVLPYGFETLGLNRLYAYQMLRNPASGRVLGKSGFTREGLLRERVRKWGRFEDVALWAILRRDWLGAMAEPPV